MKKCLLLTFVLSSLLSFSQTLNKDQRSTPGNKPDKYAVVIGISDYQDPDIPDLHFADRDAEAFARFLQSPARGSLVEDHLKLLANQEATKGGTLVDYKQRDQVILFCSRHYDVEPWTRFIHKYY